MRVRSLSFGRQSDSTFSISPTQKASFGKSDGNIRKVDDENGLEGFTSTNTDS